MGCFEEGRSLTMLPCNLLPVNIRLEPSRNAGIGFATLRGSRPGKGPLAVLLGCNIFAVGHGIVKLARHDERTRHRKTMV